VVGEWWHTTREAERENERVEARGYGTVENKRAHTLILGARHPKNDSPAPAPSDPSISTYNIHTYIIYIYIH
jgi:hypothetical protein